MALSLMVYEEARQWEYYQNWQAKQDYSGKPYTPVLTNEEYQSMTADLVFALNKREEVVHSLNLPVSIVVGWYSHPRSMTIDSVLGPSLLRITRNFSVKARVLILDVVFLLAICLQWSIVGFALQRTLARSRFFRRFTIFFSVASCAMAVTFVAIGRTPVADYAGVFLFAIFVITVLASLLTFLISSLSIPIWAIRQLRSRSKAPQVSDAQ